MWAKWLAGVITTLFVGVLILQIEYSFFQKPQMPDDPQGGNNPSQNVPDSNKRDSGDTLSNKEIENLQKLTSQLQKEIEALKKNIPEMENPTEENQRTKSKNYRMFKINGLYWLTENLYYELDQSWCQNYYEENCSKYGRYYTWHAARKACEKIGMRLPTDSEWKSLIARFGPLEGWHGGKEAYKALVKGGTSGFDALPKSGVREKNGLFKRWDSSFYWTATQEEDNNDSAVIYIFSTYYGYVTENRVVRSYESKEIALPCRCVKDI